MSTFEPIIQSRKCLQAMVSIIASTVLALSGCARLPALKIALVAPFEGRLRQSGYDAFPAVRLAIREAARESGRAVELVAYNDDGDPATAMRVARNIALDPDVVAVIGHLELSTTLAALSVYTNAGLAVIVPHLVPELLPTDPLVFRMGPRLSGATPCDQCAAHDAPPLASSPAAMRALAQFSALSLGPAAVRNSVAPYDATRMVIVAIRTASGACRACVARSLRVLRYDGLLGKIYFDTENTWPRAPSYVDNAGP